MTKMSRDVRGHAVQALRPGTGSNITVSGASSTSAVINDNCVRIYCDVDVHIRMGTAPVATVTDLLVPGGYPEYFRINPGEKIAFVTATGTGTANVTVME